MHCYPCLPALPVMKRNLLLMVLILSWGALAPASLCAQDYLLFVSTASDTRGLVYTMDGAGNLALRETITVGFDTCTVERSPYSRTVVFASYTSPTLTVVNIKPDGSLHPPVYLNDPNHGSIYNYLAFHSIDPVFYVGTLANDVIHYDNDLNTAVLVGTIPIAAPEVIIGHSVWANSLIFNRNLLDGTMGIGALRLSVDGLSGQEGPLLIQPGMFSELGGGGLARRTLGGGPRLWHRSRST